MRIRNVMSTRRGFLRHGALAGGGALLAGAQTQPAPPNETIKTIRGLRTIHGNFLDKPIPEPLLETRCVVAGPRRGFFILHSSFILP